MDFRLSSDVCVASAKGVTHCWQRASEALTSQASQADLEQRHYEVPLRLKLLASESSAFFGVDSQNDLWTWSGPGGKPVKLERFGKTVDIDAYNTCIISTDGALRCHDRNLGVGTGDQLEVNGVPGPVAVRQDSHLHDAMSTP